MEIFGDDAAEKDELTSRMVGRIQKYSQEVEQETEKANKEQEMPMLMTASMKRIELSKD